MDLTAPLLRAAAARPHILLVATPGGTAARLAAERQLRLDGLPLAPTPADAGILLVAGPDCPALRPALDRLWQHMPAPRARAQARTPEAVADAVARCRIELAARPAPGPASAPPSDGTEPPGGLPMAETAPDRDGLSLDQLHLSLGPFLADWPSGVTVRLTLQGDVIQQAEMGEQPATRGTAPFWAEPWARAAAGERVGAGEAARRRAAAHLDSLGRLLALAGWAHAATTARRLRDDLLDGAATGALRPAVRRFARRVARSRTLHWLTRGTGVLGADEARAAGVSGPAARAGGDVAARYRTWLAAVVRDVERLADPAPLDAAYDEGPRGRGDAGQPPSEALLRVLPGLLEGAELAAARLIVASLDPDPDELAAAAREVASRG
ncbi:hypothetical protein ITI46_28340 [Streptomyces oryzae]|uniref:Uncharacterized protein n=1 Tax=Streptomyces oryzae TaxID=1434886 RepID=A0ABS3XJF1_9ACTN|nr:hypothetical protein [Streptomyces oryzae]MBO8195528.1 hypothetical protein [Streptomyces oryzae]